MMEKTVTHYFTVSSLWAYPKKLQHDHQCKKNELQLSVASLGHDPARMARWWQRASLKGAINVNQNRAVHC